MVEVHDGFEAVEISGENFFVDQADSVHQIQFIEEDYYELSDFYHDNWGNKIPNDPEMRIFGGTAGQRFESLENITVIRNAEYKIVAMSGQMQQEAKDGDLGLFIVAPEYRKKGLARFMAERQIASIVETHPENSDIEVEAVTREGLNFASKLSDVVREKVRLVVKVSDSVVYEIVEEVIDSALESLEFEYELFGSCLESLALEGRLSFSLSSDQEKEFLDQSWSFDDSLELSFDGHLEEQIYEVIAFLAQRLSVQVLVDLSKAEDPEEILKILDSIGVKIDLASTAST